jgi:predicted esterase YcpF (UPF0227 family)
MSSLLYFHGFASSPGSAKITALRPLLERRGIGIVAPDLNAPSFERLDFGAMVERGIAAGESAAPRAIAGSSLGALVALAVARKAFPLPLVLIAPALGIADRWRTKLPDGDPIVVFNHARGGEAPIHRAFFEQMAELRIDEEPPASRVTVIMGRNDETVPFDTVAATWERWERRGLAAGSAFVEIPLGDHGLVEHSERIAEAIEESCR